MSLNTPTLKWIAQSLSFCLLGEQRPGAGTDDSDIDCMNDDDGDDQREKLVYKI